MIAKSLRGVIGLLVLRLAAKDKDLGREKLLNSKPMAVELAKKLKVEKKSNCRKSVVVSITSVNRISIVSGASGHSIVRKLVNIESQV